jgi:hypothetical protein
VAETTRLNIPRPQLDEPMLQDRRYLKRGPKFPYRLGELLFVLFDIAMIVFGIKAVETYHASTKGNRLIQAETKRQETLRREEKEMVAFRTARRDSLKLIEAETIAARHADSLAMADLDTAIVRVVEEIGAIAAVANQKSQAFAEVGMRKNKVFRDRGSAQAKLPGALRANDGVRTQIVALADTIAIERPKIAEAERAYEFALSQQPEVVVPKTSSASVGTQVAEGDLFATVGLGRSFFNVGKGQLGLSALTGFGPERTTVSGGGLFFNLPVIPNRASLDIGSGATVLVEGDGETDASPYLAGSLRYILNRDRRLFLLGDSRVGHDRVWTGIGIGIGRR